MTLRMLFRHVIVIPFCLALCALAQSGNYRVNIKDRILDILFALDAPTAPFLTKTTLRFSDTGTQLVVLTYPVYPQHPGGRAEIIKYSITGMGTENLSEFIAKMVAQNPNVTDREIAAKLKVDVSSSPIGYEVLNRSLNKLKTIRISPILASRVAVDEYSEYEFWYDGGQESVHYTVTGPFHDAPQDELVEWMIKFRASVPDLLKAGSARKP